jgi:IstB-like ATP binding protein
VECPRCGVVVELLPWAAGKSPITTIFPWYAATLAKLAKIDVLVLDDFLLAPMTDAERRDLLEILEDRYDRSSNCHHHPTADQVLARGLGTP